MNEYRIITDVIKKNHGSNVTIHLFAAIPTSVAFEIGRNKNLSINSKIKTYQFHQGEYTFILEI